MLLNVPAPRILRSIVNSFIDRLQSALPALATKCARRARLAACVLSATWLIAPAELRADDSASAGSAHGWEFSLALRAENGNHRSFRQLEPTTGEVRTYNARVYGGVGVSVGCEHAFTQSDLSWGLSADYWHTLFFTSAARRLGTPVDTTAQGMSATTSVSLHPFAGPDGASIGLLAGIGAMRFDFALPPPREGDADDASRELAEGDYRYLSAGLGGRLPFTPLALSLRGSYLLGLHAGRFGSRRARGQPNGLDALAALEYRVLPWLDLSLQAGVKLFLLELAPLPARPNDEPAEVRDLYFVLGLAAKAHL